MPADVPVGIRAVLKRCLQKDPRQRLHDIADVRLLMDEAAVDRPDTAAVAPLMDFMVTRFIAAPDHLHVPPIASSCDIVLGCLEVEADELWSFVQKKANAQWLWIAMDKQTRQIIAFYVGDRSRDSAQQLWQNIPEVYREQATFDTDQ